ncbi:MAG: tetratricopeptide repeat protein [Deltaproteobacteria bacterium]|nr:tetratricopeptide repeat protein [Deltaproteobacteria bacterium]MDQ3297794.1 tetratricopeptide repeat protein [Myxococcota bacterium]
MRAALIAVGVLAGVLASRVATAGPSQDLDRARANFKAKDCPSAAPLLNYLLYPKPQLANPTDLVEAHVLLGVCHYEGGNREEAKTEFKAALALDPSKTLEPLLFTEGQVRLFNEVRADVEAQARRDAELRKLEEDRDRIRKFKESLRVVETRPYFVNFVPFGAGQFQNKQTAKGILFASGQGVTFGTSAGIFLYLATKYGLVGKVPLEDGPGVRRLQQIEIATGAAFFGIYAWSVVDALLNYKPREQVEADDSLLPPDLRDFKKPTPQKKKTSLRDRLRLGPVLLPSGAGLGLSLEND